MEASFSSSSFPRSYRFRACVSMPMLQSVPKILVHSLTTTGTVFFRLHCTTRTIPRCHSVMANTHVIKIHKSSDYLDKHMLRQINVPNLVRLQARAGKPPRRKACRAQVAKTVARLARDTFSRIGLLRYRRRSSD